jgi:hypothetical protein
MLRRANLMRVRLLIYSRPNIAIDVVITRHKRASNGSVLYRGGKPLLEFLSILRPDGAWGVPGRMVEEPRNFVRELLYDKILRFKSRSPAEQASLAAAVSQLLVEGEVILTKSAFCQDERITDNAWLEVRYYIVVLVHKVTLQVS